MWRIFAVVSALFAALTAIFIKSGAKSTVADPASAVRTAITVVPTWGIIPVKVSTGRLTMPRRQRSNCLLLPGRATFHPTFISTGTPIIIL